MAADKSKRNMVWRKRRNSLRQRGNDRLTDLVTVKNKIQDSQHSDNGKKRDLSNLCPISSNLCADECNNAVRGHAPPPIPPPYVSTPAASPQLYPDLTKMAAAAPSTKEPPPPPPPPPPPLPTDVKPKVKCNKDRGTREQPHRNAKELSKYGNTAQPHSSSVTLEDDGVHAIKKQFPMIELSNPAYIGPPGPGEEHPEVLRFQPTVLVYRPWLDADSSETVREIPYPKDKLTQFFEGMTNLLDSFKLNGHETERAYRKVLKVDWCAVSGDWRARDNTGNILPPKNAVLLQRVRELNDRIGNKWRVKHDWTRIQNTTQNKGEGVEAYRTRLQEIFDSHSGLTKPGNDTGVEPYWQHLKSVFLQNMHPHLAKYIHKRLITYNTCAFGDVLTYAKHAERLEEERKEREDKKSKAKPTPFYMIADPRGEAKASPTSVFYQGATCGGGG
ncbi:uncharacterized protein KZ484_020072 [Pholidichthys leucotaenia]